MLNTQDVLKLFGERLVRDIRAEIQTKDLTGHGPSVATGNLLNSVRAEVSDNTLSIYALEYIGALQFGRKPTQNDNNGGKTLREAILEWIDVKGIMPDGISKESLAYLIARKIHREGTTIYRRTHGESSGLLDNVLNDGLVEEIKAALMFAVVQNFKNTLFQTIPKEMIEVT